MYGRQLGSYRETQWTASNWRQIASPLTVARIKQILRYAQDDTREVL